MASEHATSGARQARCGCRSASMVRSSGSAMGRWGARRRPQAHGGRIYRAAAAERSGTESSMMPGRSRGEDLPGDVAEADVAAVTAGDGADHGDEADRECAQGFIAGGSEVQFPPGAVVAGEPREDGSGAGLGALRDASDRAAVGGVQQGPVVRRCRRCASGARAPNLRWPAGANGRRRRRRSEAAAPGRAPRDRGRTARLPARTPPRLRLGPLRCRRTSRRTMRRRRRGPSRVRTRPWHGSPAPTPRRLRRTPCSGSRRRRSGSRRGRTHWGCGRGRPRPRPAAGFHGRGRVAHPCLAALAPQPPTGPSQRRRPAGGTAALGRPRTPCPLGEPSAAVSLCDRLPSPGPVDG